MIRFNMNVTVEGVKYREGTEVDISKIPSGSLQPLLNTGMAERVQPSQKPVSNVSQPPAKKA